MSHSILTVDLCNDCANFAMNKHPCCWEFVDRYIYTKVPKRYTIIYFNYTTEFTWIQLTIMLKSWLINSPSATKPGQKRKAVDEPEECMTPRKFHKVLNQNDFDWYVKDESGIWHCTLCRSVKFRSAYAVGHKENKRQQTMSDMPNVSVALIYFVSVGLF